MLLRNHQPGERPLFRNIQPGAVTPRQPSTTVETVHSSDSDKHYLDTLDQLIADLVARKISNFADLSRSCAGAWPSLVADRLRKLKTIVASDDPVRFVSTSILLTGTSLWIWRMVFFLHLRREARRRVRLQAAIFVIAWNSDYSPASIST